MSTSPPQLHLSLPPPHQSFKRSFQQFGLDVESPGATEGSSSSSVVSGSSIGASMNGSFTSPNSSSSSSTSGDVHVNERNKRARSEGPDRQSDNDEPRGRSSGSATSPPTLPQIRPLNATTYSSNISGGFSPFEESGTSDLDGRSLQTADSSSAPHALRAGLSSSPPSDRQTTYTRSSMITTTLERPYSNLLHPRLSSPVPPPPRMDEDFTMMDDSYRLPSMQTRPPAEVHEEAVRNTLERAQEFDRSIAPLRSDPSDLETSHERQHSFATASDSLQDELDSLRAAASESIQDEVLSSFLTDLESPATNASNRFPRTSGLRPASRYSQAAAMYRPQSPPSPRPSYTRPSVRNETAIINPGPHLNRATGWSPSVRSPSPEIPTFHHEQTIADQEFGNVQSRLRERIEALLDDIDSQPIFPLSLELGEADGVLEDEEQPASETQNVVLQGLRDAHMRASVRSGRMIRAAAQHMESQRTNDAIPPIRPLQRSSWAGRNQMQEVSWDHSQSSYTPRLLMRPMRGYVAPMGGTSSTPRAELSRESYGPVRPNLPTLRTAIYGSEVNGMDGYFSERSREAEMLRRTAGRTPPSPNFPMPSAADVLYGARTEGGSGPRRGGLMDNEDFRQRTSSLLSSLERQLSQHDEQATRQETASNRPSLSLLREMNRLPIRTRSVERSTERHSAYERSSLRSVTSTTPATASSSEAAAYFASSRTYPTPSGTAAPRVVRHSVESYRDPPSSSRPESMFVSEQSEVFSFDSDAPRLPTPDSHSASSDLLNLVYPGRFTVTEPDVERVISRPSREGHTAPEGLRHRSWLRQRVGSSHMVQRNEHEPPSLPPMRFEQTFVPVPRDDSEWRRVEFDWRQPSRPEQPMSGGLMADARRSLTSHLPSSPMRNALQVGNYNADAAIQRARLFRSVESRLQPEEQDGRSQGFQRALHVLRSDGLSPSRQHQFQNAFERQQQRASMAAAPRENHSHWGEIRSDNIDRRHFSLLSRRRGSALFADPPDNPDNAPPNRGSGTATNAHTVNHQGPPSPMSEFFSRFSSRPRVRNRARAMRQGEDAPSGGPLGFSFFGRRRSSASFGAGDFMRDEDFDESYESLLALAATLGDAKPRATPAHHLAALPTAFYKDWQTKDSDSRCPICLDDYKPLDPVLKAEPCDHWCHKECLEQWLHSARTCPVCRSKINPNHRPVSPKPVAGPSHANRHHEDDSDDSSPSSTPSPIEPAIFAALSASY